LTDFVTFNKFYVLNEKPARNRHILAHNSSGLDFLNYKTSSTGPNFLSSPAKLDSI